MTNPEREFTDDEARTAWTQGAAAWLEFVHSGAYFSRELARQGARVAAGRRYSAANSSSSKRTPRAARSLMMNG